VRASERTRRATWELAPPWCGHGRTRFLRLSTTRGRSAALRRSRSGSMIGARAARLDEALRSCGCQPGTATTTSLGCLWLTSVAEHLVIENVGQAGLAEWPPVKLQMLRHTESPPAQSGLAIEIAVRQVELALADYKLGTIDGEPVAVLGRNRGSISSSSNLGTRMPYRAPGHRPGHARPLGRTPGGPTVVGP